MKIDFPFRIRTLISILFVVTRTIFFCTTKYNIYINVDVESILINIKDYELVIFVLKS